VGARGEIVVKVKLVEGKNDENELRPGGFIDLARGWRLC